MRIILSVILIFFLITAVKPLIPENLKSDFFNIYKNVAIETREIQHRPVTPDNVTFYLFTSDNPTEYIKLDPTNLKVIANQLKKIVFFIHGWTSSREVDWFEDLKNAFLLTHKDYVVVQVDWNEPANQLYYVSSINTYDVGKIVTDLILDLNKNYKLNLDDILLIGHSLGGQVSGFIGKEIYKSTGKKLPRIIALDPAGPLFSQRPDDKRLNKTDAEVVEVIHTDAGTFGFSDPCGTIDFFPNGGSSQPGCKRIDLLDITSVADPVTCDHTRAAMYLIEAVLNPNDFVAKKCSDWDKYENNECDQGEEVALGNITTKSVGLFYFETNKDKPFAKRKSDKKGGIGLSKILNTFNPSRLLQH